MHVHYLAYIVLDSCLPISLSSHLFCYLCSMRSLPSFFPASLPLVFSPLLFPSLSFLPFPSPLHPFTFLPLPSLSFPSLPLPSLPLFSLSSSSLPFSNNSIHFILNKVVFSLLHPISCLSSISLSLLTHKGGSLLCKSIDI